MTEKDNRPPRLSPIQVCYIVDDVAEAVAVCETALGWGPFNHFTAEVESASYRDWSGSKRVDVALGMAGAVQIELMHIHKGEDPVATFQSHYGTGIQHLGIHCKDRDQAIAFLNSVGSPTNEISEYPGIRFAFMDTPTGEGMFELVCPTDTFESSEVSGGTATDSAASNSTGNLVKRVTIATNDIVGCVNFYASAFGWQDVRVDEASYQVEGQEYAARRSRAAAGLLEFEFVEPASDSSCPYRQHLARGGHGIVHAGVAIDGEAVESLRRAKQTVGAGLSGQWLDTEEAFTLHSWEGGLNSLQFYT